MKIRLDGSGKPVRTLSSATFSFISFSRILTITPQHDCFEKFEEPHRRCWPNGASRYTQSQCQRQHGQTCEITNSNMYEHCFSR
jgi:hypothetical protein